MSKLGPREALFLATCVHMNQLLAAVLAQAADSVRDVNSQRDKSGLSYARKAMIRTGMSFNVNGLWEEKQLCSPLQSHHCEASQSF